nr:hypothetical protein [Tanacetum cinerariifolium]
MTFCVYLSALDQRFKKILGLLFRDFPSTAPPAAADVAIPDPTLKDLAVGTPSVKVMAKAEAFKKRKASTFGSALSHVAKRTRLATAHSPGSTSCPSLFVQDTNDDESDNEDACFEIPLIIPIQYAATIPTKGNQSGGSVPSAIEDSRGKAIMSDAADAPSGEDGVVIGSYEFPTPGEMVWIESLSNDRLFGKMSVLHCLIMSYRGELLAQYNGLLKSHAKTKGKDRKKKVKSLSKSLDHATAEVACLSSDLNQARNIEAKKDAEILRLRASPPMFASFF